MHNLPTPSTDHLVFTSFGPNQSPTTIYFTNTNSVSPSTSQQPISPTPSRDQTLSTPSYPSFDSNYSPAYKPSTNTPYFNISGERKIDQNRPTNSPTVNDNNLNIKNLPNFNNPFNSIINPSDHQPSLNFPIPNNYPSSNLNPTQQPSFSRIFSPKFNGLNINTSFLRFEKDKHEYSTSFMVHFDFITDSPNGILFHAEAEYNPIVFAIVYLGMSN